MIDAFSVNVAKITPFISKDFYGAVVQSFVVESLAGRDAQTLEWSPQLAQTWKIQDNVEVWQAYVDQRQAVPLTEAEVRAEAGFAPLETDEARQTYLDRA